MYKSVPGKNRKLYENFINNCYYEPNKFLIETPDEELIKKFYGEIGNTVESGVDHFEIYSVAHRSMNYRTIYTKLAHQCVSLKTLYLLLV